MEGVDPCRKSSAHGSVLKKTDMGCAFMKAYSYICPIEQVDTRGVYQIALCGGDWRTFTIYVILVILLLQCDKISQEPLHQSQAHGVVPPLFMYSFFFFFLPFPHPICRTGLKTKK